ncbi:MAG TPA: hypothetical protein VN457_04980, partial [Chlamydiales bacterium]|nr:hypothetical protein [Chlamydiales bacterium]
MSQQSFDFTQHDYQFTELDKELAIEEKPVDKQKKESEKAQALHTFIVTHPPKDAPQAEKLLTFTKAYKQHLEKGAQQTALEAVQKIEQQANDLLLMKASLETVKKELAQVKSREINPTLQKALTYVLSHDESFSYLKELFATPLTKFQAIAIINAMKESTKTEPLSPHLKTLKIIRAQTEALKEAPKTKERAIQTLLRTVFFKEVTLKKVSDTAKKSFSAEETMGLPIERHGDRIAISLGSTGVWKNKQIVRLVDMDKPRQVFGRVITHHEVVEQTAVVISNGHKPFVEKATAIFKEVKKPLDDATVAQLKTTFVEGIALQVPLATLHSIWQAHFQGKTAVVEHQKEFFAIYLKALQEADSEKIGREFDELQKMASSLFSDPDLNRLMQQIKATMQEAPVDKAVQKFCLEALLRVFSSSFATDVVSIVQAQRLMARIGFLKDRTLLADVPWTDWKKASEKLESETKKALETAFAT